MDNIVMFADILTIILTVGMCSSALKRWKTSEISPFYYIFVFFYVVPIFLDYFYAFPTYTYTRNIRGFHVSYNDTMTRVIYDILVISVQWFLLHIKIRKYAPVVVADKKNYFKKMTAFLYAGLVIAPVMVLLKGQDKSILYTFMWRENELSSSGYLPIAERLSYVGICCAVVLFFWKTEKRGFIRIVLSVLFAYVNICIEGKRSITFFLFLVIFVVMLPGIRDRSISAKKRKKMIFILILLLVLILIVMINFTIKVKMENRGYSDMDSVYTTIRIDFFRDDRVRMAIYALLYPENMTILTFPGQTLVPAILNFFPLDYVFSYIGIHPIAYTAYISAALAGRTVVSQADAFMTPAIFAELISNFHIIGFILFIALTIWFAKMAERYPYPSNVFILVSYIMLNMYSISYIAYFLEITFIMCAVCRSQMSKNKIRL